MAPNLLVAMTTAVRPLNTRRWSTPRLNGSIDIEHHCRKVVDCSNLPTEHWNSPVPGYYAYVSGKGWYLVSRDSEIGGGNGVFFRQPSEGTLSRKSSRSASSRHSEDNDAAPTALSPSTPEPVVYSHILHKHILARDFKARLRWDRAVRPSSIRGKSERLGFFQLDDGFSWVIAYDKNGMEDREPNKSLWVLETGKDKEKKMRLMTKEESLRNPLRMVKMERY